MVPHDRENLKTACRGYFSLKPLFKFLPQHAPEKGTSGDSCFQMLGSQVNLSTGPLGQLGTLAPRLISATEETEADQTGILLQNPNIM